MSETWTKDQLAVEFDHIMETRLAILCGMDQPTAEQLCIAIQEAEEHVEKLAAQ